MSALTVWSLAAEAVVEPLATTFVSALSVATTQLTSVAGPSPEPGIASAVGVTRVHSRTPSGSGSPDARPCRKTGASAARAGSAAASGPASTAVAATAFSAVRRRGESELGRSDEVSALSEDLYRLVTDDQITDQYDKRAGELPKVRPLFLGESDQLPVSP